MKFSLAPKVRHILTVFALGFAVTTSFGCGESAPPEPSKPQATPNPATSNPVATSKSKGKGKNVDPTALMERDELRAYRKQQKEQGKSN